MGAAQSYLNPQLMVTGAVVVGAVGLGYTQIASSSSNNAQGDSSGANKGKGKKKYSPLAADVELADKSKDIAGTTSTVVPFPAVIPGQFDALGSDDVATGTENSSVSKGKKGKKKKGGNKTVETAAAATSTSVGREEKVEQSLVSPAAASVLAESAASDSGTPVTPATKSKKSKRQRKQQGTSQSKAGSPASVEDQPAEPELSAETKAKPKTKAQPSATAASSRQLQQSVASVASLATDTDGEWTRVSRKGDKKGTSSLAGGTGAVSDAGQYTTASVTTGTSSSVDARTEEEEEEEEEEEILSGPGERQPLAKRLLPKPRKTGVEDMLSTPDYPTYSRVMRVQPGPTEKPAEGFSWGDYEDVITGPDGSARVGASGYNDADADADGEDDGWGVVKRSGRSKKTPSSSFTEASSSSSTAPETMTKRKRQNIARRDAQKEAKAEAERQRLETLQKHKRELEKARIAEQYSGKSKSGLSGGMKATVDEKGKLVWD